MLVLRLAEMIDVRYLKFIEILALTSVLMLMMHKEIIK